MKIFSKMIILIAFAGMFSIACAQEKPSSDSKPLSLQQCFELACRKSEALGLKEQDIRIAEAHYWAAISGLFPKISVKATDTFSTDGSSALGGNSSTTSTRGLFGPNDNFQGVINLKQPLFNGFREFSAVKAADAEEKAGKFSLRRARQLLYFDTADTFYQILSYEGDREILKDLENALKERVQELERRVKLGRSRKSELLSSQTDLADAQAAIEKTNKILAASRELMAFLTGLPTEQIKLEETTPFPSAENIENYLAHTGEHLDVLTQIQKLREAKGLLSIAKAEHWPSVNVEGNYVPYAYPQTDRNWNISLTVEVPIFEGGLIEAKVRENEALVRKRELNLSEMQRSIEKNIRTSYSNFISSAAGFARLTELKNISQQNLEEQKKDYERGIASNLEVLTALGGFQGARRQALASEYDARRAWVQLLVSSGSEIPEVPAENNLGEDPL